jgi:phosphonate transport system substrate-binding protein
MKRRIFLSLAVLGLLAAESASAQTPSELNFGIISTESQQNLKPRYTPFLADLEKAVGLKVNGFFASDYAGIVEAMRFGKVSLAWLGNASAMVAVDRASGEVFAQNLAPDGSDGYYSVVIVHKDSPIQDFQSLLRSPGKYTLSSGDPNSTSGFLIPSYYAWAANNIDPRKHFVRVISANHEVNALAVANRQVDLATVSSEALERIEGTAPDKRALLREIWRSPVIPLDPMVWRVDLPQTIKEKVRAFFIGYGSPLPDKSGAQLKHEKAVLEGLQSGSFRASSNKQLLPLRQIALFRDKIKIENDDKLSAAEKATQIREIEAKLTQLRLDAGT